ncbi:probable pectinesterase/pectinesterase inhibitor 21 [Euphorbia lathyris]|uniref:probable pectinesterase/pectinesterase inhibitor 21 n=1 Tax=Euphorbia lathyris TaxID=212925 RepID=UPI003314365F
MTYEEDNNAGRNKRLITIGVCSFLLVSMVICVTISLDTGEADNGSTGLSGKNHKSQTTDHISASAKAIKSMCQPTLYKDTCEKSLHQYAGTGNTTEPKELMKFAFMAAEEEILAAANISDTLKLLEKDERTVDALDCCKELMNMSFSELEHAIDKISHLDIGYMDELMEDLRVWISAAITYEETCLDGFKNTTTHAGEKMTKALKTAMEMSSNGLDIVAELSTVISTLQLSGISRRRILGQDSDMPEWLDAGSRRLLATPVSTIKADVVVAKDGSGDFKTIKKAMNKIPDHSNKTFVMYVKKGTYNEYLEFNHTMTKVLLIGDGFNETRITGNKSFTDGINAYHSPTVVIGGENFMAKNIGFENTAGASEHEAVALRVTADFAIFFNCSMEGYQHTLYAHAKRQFYRDCTISGTVDIVSGDAKAMFQNCTFLIRKPLQDQICVLTKQTRKVKREPTAIVIHNSTITAHPDLVPFKQHVNVFFGRPAKEYSRTVVMESFIDDVIHPQGWTTWMGSFGQKSCWFAEYNNYGPGAQQNERVKWEGVKTNIKREQATEFSSEKFLHPDSWIKPSGVTFNPDLILTT